MILLIYIGLLVLLLPWGFWFSHVSMNLDERKPYDFVHFKTFLREFDKYKDDPNLEFGWNNKSIFLRKNGEDILYLHAGIVRINGKCMIFYPIDFIKYNVWMKKYNGNNRVKGLWNAE